MGAWLVLRLLLPLLLLIKYAAGSGYFELQILEFSNYRLELSSGRCCGSSPPAAPPCGAPCRTRFSLCLKEYQTAVTAGVCTFGNTSSGVLGTDSFTLPDPESGALLLPFTFRWTRSFTLILQAYDDYNYTDQDETGLIEEASYSGIIEPSAEWHTLKHAGHAARVTYRVRVQCQPNYYNTTCTTFCRPRDDKFGHYSCGKTGEKRCLPGWQGDNCEIPVCKSGCHPVHGKCDRSGDCTCRHGWRGEFCDQCQPYPGCKHGYCNGSSWDCTCDTNWGGILCDQDLNYCGTHEPCHHGGTCENTAPDQYLCTCAEGFSGVNCEVVDNPCAPQPCQHGGRCELAQPPATQGFICFCAAGWTGPLCDVDIDECASSPCQNGGTCVDLVDAYKCECVAGWDGDHCQYDVDECTSRPCVNALSCSNTAGSYSCNCVAGWAGKDCELNIDDCVGQCEHGATCIDLVDDFHCACAPGYTGRTCATDIDDCALRPCKNGGECVDMVDAYKCICPVGFSGTDCELTKCIGRYCQDDRDHCTPDPCQNAAPCYNTQGDYYCHCPADWTGKNCSQRTALCGRTSCEDATICVDDISCGAHGRCMRNVSPPRCICDPGFGGPHCRENINDCKLNPCTNGGTCVDLIDSYRCICREGWTGDLCHINVDDCASSPCRNNGTCIDGLADFSCACKDGWKGKTCNLRDSACEESACRNGGTCVERGGGWACECGPQWGGAACQLPAAPACTARPCLHGATCVNALPPAHFTCICRDGYTGVRCETDIDECASQPCYNGGRCVDGLNWFRCECAPGFGGPDCRINVNECASGPCARGATCVDHIAGYRCLCPPGYTGLSCLELSADGGEEASEASGALGVPLSCARGDNATWWWGCNVCACDNGAPVCTNVWCGLPNCLAGVACHPDEVCVPSAGFLCVRGPCAPLGECRRVSGRSVAPPPLPAPSSCWANQAKVSPVCAHLSLQWEGARVREGAHVERACGALRRALAAAHAALHVRAARPVVLLCDLQPNDTDTLELALSISEDDVDTNVLSASVKALSEFVSRRRQRDHPLLGAALELRSETAVESSASPGLLVLAALAPLTMAGLAAGLYVFFRRKKRLDAAAETIRRCDEEKSNNLQNEENLRRYANPLREEPKEDCEPHPLYKPQNADARNNTATNGRMHKDFTKRPPGTELRMEIRSPPERLTVLV